MCASGGLNWGWIPWIWTYGLLRVTWYECWEPDLSLLQEQHLLLTTEPSPSPRSKFFWQEILKYSDMSSAGGTGRWGRWCLVRGPPREGPRHRASAGKEQSLGKRRHASLTPSDIHPLWHLKEVPVLWKMQFIKTIIYKILSLPLCPYFTCFTI